MADISEFNINNTLYNLKDKILREAAECPISSTTNDLPSTWGVIGTGFFSISSLSTIIDQPNQKGFIYSLVDNPNDENNINITQLFFDYVNNSLHSRTGILNINENIDNWSGTWVTYTNSGSPFTRSIIGLDVQNHKYTNNERQIIRIIDEANYPFLKFREINNESTSTISAELSLTRPVNNQSITNYFKINIDENGYGTYEVSRPYEFRKTLGATTNEGIWPIELGGTGANTSTQALANLGGISNPATTTLIINGAALRIVDPAISLTTLPNNTVSNGRINFRDNFDNQIGSIRTLQTSTGSIGLQFQSKNIVNSNIITKNPLSLGVDVNGNSFYEIENQIGFRNALGASNGIWPIELGGIGTSTKIDFANNFFGGNLNTNPPTHFLSCVKDGDITSIGNTRLDYAWKAICSYTTGTEYILPITKGGTGSGTASEAWENIRPSWSLVTGHTNHATNVASGTIFLRKWGLVYNIFTNAAGIELGVSLGTSGKVIASFGSDAVPGLTRYFYGCCIENNAPVLIVFESGGSLKFYSTSGTIAKANHIIFNCTYLRSS